MCIFALPKSYKKKKISQLPVAKKQDTIRSNQLGMLTRDLESGNEAKAIAALGYFWFLPSSPRRVQQAA